MQIETVSEVPGVEFKQLVFGEVKIPVPTNIYEMITNVKGLSHEQRIAIVRDGGLEINDLVSEKDVMTMAMSFVQNAWYTADQGSVSKTVGEGHANRLERYAAALAGTPAFPEPVTEQESIPKKWIFRAECTGMFECEVEAASEEEAYEKGSELMPSVSDFDFGELHTDVEVTDVDAH